MEQTSATSGPYYRIRVPTGFQETDAKSRGANRPA